MHIVVGDFVPPEVGAVEVVERKGAGHPDSLCDRVCDLFGLELARYYREQTGHILHHNVDKALLCAGEGRGRDRQGLEVVESLFQPGSHQT